MEQTFLSGLKAANEDFAAGRISAVVHGRLREANISMALFEMAHDFGVVLQTPLLIDSNGDYSLVACPEDGSSPEYGCGKFGLHFAEALNWFGVRTGSPGPNRMDESSGWCKMNHFAAEKMVTAYAENNNAWQHQNVKDEMENQTPII